MECAVRQTHTHLHRTFSLPLSLSLFPPFILLVSDARLCLQFQRKQTHYDRFENYWRISWLLRVGSFTFTSFHRPQRPKIIALCERENETKTQYFGYTQFEFIFLSIERFDSQRISIKNPLYCLRVYGTQKFIVIASRCFLCDAKVYPRVSVRYTYITNK